MSSKQTKSGTRRSNRATKRNQKNQNKNNSQKRKQVRKQNIAQDLPGVIRTDMIKAPQTLVLTGTGKYKMNQSDYGARLGATLGEGAQYLMKALGFGDYEIQQNSLMSSIELGADGPPVVANSYQGEGTRIRHREYIGDLYTGTPSGGVSPFTLQSFPLQIGSNLLFPWGSEVAANFQHWKPDGMLVELKSLSSTYAANVSLGSMFCAVDYNSLDPAPTSELQLLNMEYARSSKPAESILMPVECAPQNTVQEKLFIAKNGNYEQGNRQFYDLGNLFIGSAGVPITGSNPVPIAQIWVTYDVILFKPILAEGQLACRYDLRLDTLSGQVYPFNSMGPSANDAFGMINVLRTEDFYGDGSLVFNSVCAGKTFLVVLWAQATTAYVYDAGWSVGKLSGLETLNQWFFTQTGEATGRTLTESYVSTGGTLKVQSTLVIFSITFPAVFPEGTDLGFMALFDTGLDTTPNATVGNLIIAECGDLSSNSPVTPLASLLSDVPRHKGAGRPTLVANSARLCHKDIEKCEKLSKNSELPVGDTQLTTKIFTEAVRWITLNPTSTLRTLRDGDDTVYCVTLGSSRSLPSNDTPHTSSCGS